MHNVKGCPERNLRGRPPPEPPEQRANLGSQSSGCQFPTQNLPEKAHQRNNAEPQVKPPPIASSRMRLPRFMRRSATASASASGIEAAEVFP